MKINAKKTISVAVFIGKPKIPYHGGIKLLSQLPELILPTKVLQALSLLDRLESVFACSFLINSSAQAVACDTPEALQCIDFLSKSRL